MNKRHGGPYDRGAADSFYQRAWDPHYYVAATYTSRRVSMSEMTPAEIVEYNRGFRMNEESGNFKDWGEVC